MSDCGSSSKDVVEIANEKSGVLILPVIKHLYGHVDEPRHVNNSIAPHPKFSIYHKWNLHQLPAKKSIMKNTRNSVNCKGELLSSDRKQEENDDVKIKIWAGGGGGDYDEDYFKKQDGF